MTFPRTTAALVEKEYYFLAARGLGLFALLMGMQAIVVSRRRNGTIAPIDWVTGLLGGLTLLFSGGVFRSLASWPGI